jgi:tetratricopeptide (TPR) repeat protein
MHLLIRPLIGVVVLSAAAPALAQSLPDVRALYDAGKYSAAVETIGRAGGAAPPQLLYLEGLSRERLGQAEAGGVYARLAASDAPVWKSIGQSAVARRSKQTGEALAAAERAVAQDAGVAEAHYQLGLVLVDREDWPRAAAAFDKAAELDPRWSYARYHGGLAYYRVKRVDLMAERFETFLKLAPNAPERPEVETILRTLRGR